jgi:hypothetical protein
MAADVSRIRLNPLLDFAGVELKQGGVVLDADFNELVGVIDRRLRAAASDILGRNTASQTTPDAFRITLAGGTLQIGKGRLYVDGLLAENHGVESNDAAKQLFDPLLSEVTFADLFTYLTQPYLKNPPALPTAGRHLVYIDVWEREVTHIERPDLVEVAVGVETSSRKQIVWQVRVLDPAAGTATCATPDGELNGWADVIAPSTGRVTNGTFDVPPEDDPCELPPSGGYRGLENQTYRIEIHDPGQPGGAATFKWSRDNASVASRVASMVSATELELQTLGRDDVLRFNTGDWVEITDDVRELSQKAGEMRQIVVSEETRRISFTTPLPAGMVPGAFPNSDFPRDRNLRVRRWDQKHKVLRVGAGGTTPVFQDLDVAGGTGLINVPAAGTTLILENGVTVSFSSTGAKGFRPGDYWVFAARTADTSVEPLTNAPPRGIHHHYGRLGVWDVAAGSVTDCRGTWPPRADGHDCSCTACVTAESHANGTFTIQDAVNAVRETGGTVCIGVGQYALAEPVRVTNARALRIRGQGAATVLVTPGSAFIVDTGIALAIEDLAIVSLGLGSAIRIRTVLGLSLQRLIVFVLGSRDATGAGISLGGIVLGATIRDNAVFAPTGIQGAVSEPGEEGPRADLLLSAALRIESNVLWCERSAIALAGQVLHAMAARIDRNDIVNCRRGAIAVLGLCGPGASMRITDNQFNIGGAGISAAVDGLWITGNKLAAIIQREDRQAAGAGIMLRTGLDPTGSDQCQILSNQISGFTGAAIAIQSPVRDLIVKLNLIERCGNGIVLSEETNASSVSIENNHLTDIGATVEGDQTAFVVGILLSRAVAGAVAGNVLRRIGRTEGRVALRAGIAAASVRRLRVTSNDLAEIGPAADFVGVAAGILVLAPYVHVEVALNHVTRDLDPPSPATSRAQWFALLVDQPNDTRIVARAGLRAAVRLDDSRTLVVGDRRPFVDTAGTITDAAGAAVVRPAGTSVLGNVLEARGTSPAVEVAVAGDCLFNDNRCESLFTQGGAAVRLLAGTAIVNANRVRSGEVSMQLMSDPKRITVVGNVTTGAIVSGTGALGAPWDVLNVRA